MIPEQVLWLNVLKITLKDGCYGPLEQLQNVRMIKDYQKFKEHLIKRARNYFDVSNRDFVDVCVMAGLDPRTTAMSAWKVFEDFDNGKEPVLYVKAPTGVSKRPDHRLSHPAHEGKS